MSAVALLPLLPAAPSLPPPPTWPQACDQLVSRCLSEWGVERPPVHGRRLAEQLGLTALTAQERRPPSALRRVAASLLPRLAASLGRSLQEVTHTEGRAWTHALLVRLAAPGAWLTRDGAALDWDLAALVGRYRCSPVLLARRMLEVSQEATLTIFADNWLIYRESRPAGVRPLTRLELACRAQLLSTGRPTDLRDGSERVQGWAFVRRGRSREVLRTTSC